MIERILSALAEGPATIEQLAARLGEPVERFRFELGYLLGTSVRRTGSSWGLMTPADTTAAFASRVAGLALGR